VIATVNIGMKRQLHQLSYYSEGNIPESLIGVPDAWTPDQIKNFQDYWDLYFTGDLARRRRAKFVPGGVARTFIQTKEPELKSAFDEWIARVVCFAFSVTPQPFINQMNRATSETQKDMADQEGLLPILAWVKRLCDHVIVMLGGEGLEFVWNTESVIDPTVQRENLVAYVGAGMMTRRRAAEIMGETLPDDPMADVLTMTTGQGVVLLGRNSLPSDIEKKKISDQSDEGHVDKYSDAQPRDANGRWTGGGNVPSPVLDTKSSERSGIGTTNQLQVAATTRDFRKACKLLGIDPIDAGDAIHAAKAARRLSGGDECVFDLKNGDIIFQGEVIGNLHD
jgi:hypothetical protein